MADKPDKVGVYDTPTDAASRKTDVKVERSAKSSNTVWWIVGLIVLAVIIAVILL